MPRKPISQKWKSDRALLLCHGVGNYREGDYDNVKAALRAAVGASTWESIAVYEVFYDEINDWIAEKNRVGDVLSKALAFIKGKFDPTSVSQAAAEGAGDVLWPVLSLPARDALRRAYVSQLLQLVIDGERELDPRDQKVVLMGHSLGCFHTYEALWAVATDPQYGMLPALGDGPVYTKVVLMASPVQLIRRVATEIRAFVPRVEGLATARASGLAIPAQIHDGRRFPAIQGMVSLTGNMDPVGGHLLGQRLDWAWMNIPNEPMFKTIVELQDIVNRPADANLAQLFLQLAQRNDPGISIENPHSWERYITHNAAKVAEWVLA